ncbi:MAG: carbon storage regulator [Geminicoccaceae bacterium]
MLYLTRRTGEAVIIDNRIEIRIVEVHGRTVKLGLNFPPDVQVLREEVYLEVKAANEAAAERGDETPPEPV